MTTQRLGEVVLAWNDLLVSCLGLFSVVVRIPNRLVAYRIWNSITSDRNQIEMLKALSTLPALGIDVPKDIRDEIDWVLKEVSDLIDVRNDLVHSPFVIASGEIAPLHLGTHKRAKKFNGRNLQMDCEWFYECCVALREYIGEIEDILSDRRKATSLRPKLPMRPIPKAAADRKK